MARRRKMDPERRAFINNLLQHYQSKDAQDVQEMLEDLLGEILQGMPEAEMEDHLGYSISIENFNRQLRKVTKAKTIFSTDDALFKSLYLAMMYATKKRIGRSGEWRLTLDQLCIYFEDRIRPEDIY